MFKTILIVPLIFSIPVFAILPGHGGPACAPIRAACEKAGQGNGPDAIRDCLFKWAAGGSIPGLTTRPTDPTAKDCAEHLERMKSHTGPDGRPGYGQSAPQGPRHPPLPRANRPPAPLAPRNPNPAAPAVLPPVPTTPPPKKP